MPARQITHVLVAILAWVAFAALWVLLYHQGKVTPHAIGLSVGAVAAMTAGVAIVTLAWVAHNVRIHRRKGPRTNRVVLAPRTDVDRLERPVRWDFPSGHNGARKTWLVVIDIDGEVKRYRTWG